MAFLYGTGKSFELVGNIQDFLVIRGKVLLESLLGQRYDALESEIRNQINISRESTLTSEYQQKSNYWLVSLVKAIQFTYDFVRRGDNEGPRGGVIGLLANTFRWFLEKQIPAYLNSCDGVTISRREDIDRYQIKTQIWEVPYACDLEKFKVYDPSINDFIAKVHEAVELGDLSSTGASELIKFTTDENLINKKCILYVGRLSDEKNISILMDAYEQLLGVQGIRDIHFILIGAGYAAANIKNKFRDRVTVTGLVPNYLLPDIYNFIRQRNGFFVSASDTETYGITHEEATACGVPLIAMEKGTRGHLYCPGDTTGQFTIENDALADTIEQLATPWKTKGFIIGLNGLCIPDYSGGLGLSKLSTNHPGRDSATKTLLSAMYVMAMLPDRVITRMSQSGFEFTVASKLGWDGTWQLIQNGVYVNNLELYNSIITKKKHVYV